VKRALLWAALFIPVLVNTSYKTALWSIACAFALFILKKQAWIFIGLCSCVFLNFNLKTMLPIESSSKIIELNDNSFIITSENGKVLVMSQNVNHYNLLDEVKVLNITPFSFTPSTYGFNQQNYVLLNGLVGTSTEDEILSHKPNPWMNFIGLGGFNSDPVFQKLSRALLFQTDPENSFISVISLGLIYSILYKLCHYVLSFFLKENITTFILLILFGLGAYVFAYPLSLIRVMVSIVLVQLFKDRSSRLIGFVLFFLMYDQSSFTSITILYPLLFQIISTFKLDQINRWNTMSIFQYAFFHKVSLGLVVLYPVLRKLMALMIILIWVAYVFVPLTPFILWIYQNLQSINGYLERIFILRGSISISVTFFMVLILTWSYFYKVKSKFLWLALVMLVPLLSVPWFYQVSFISVGQGDAILLQAPFNQEVILIDTGKENAYDQLSLFLNAQGISRIDRLIITHSDNDHSGNWDRLLVDYDIMRSISEPTDINLKWFTLTSLKTTLMEPDVNQASLVYLFQIKDVKFLMMADADEFTEQDLLKQYPDLKTDILKVGHHGSSTSSSDIFLSHIQAKLAIISVGPNSYGHPSWKTLQRLASYHVSVLTTQNEGDITFILNEVMDFLQTSSRKLKQLRLGF
jgi:competence protein ComEC